MIEQLRQGMLAAAWYCGFGFTMTIALLVMLSILMVWANVVNQKPKA